MMQYFNHAWKPMLAVIASLALTPATSQVLADVVIDAFDTDAEVAAWSATWGTSPVLEFSTENHGGLASSGSLKVSADYFTAADDGWEQMVITRTFDTPIVGSDFASVSVDIKVDPASVPTSGGQYGYFELKRTTDGSSLGGVNLTSTNWTTITLPLAVTEGSLPGIIIQNGNGGFQGPITYYLDNFVFTSRAAQVPPPKLAMERNSNPGLRLYASAANEAYQRQNIVYAPSEDIANQLWWVNQPNPLTYSVTWADFPDKNAYRGFQGHIMLITDSGMGTGNPIPDYADPNVVMIEFQYVNTPGPDGTNGTADDVVMAQARLLHKVNEANGNGMLYRGANTNNLPVGVLGLLQAPSMLGTWSVSFQNNTTVVLTAPDNTTTNLTIPAADAALYEPATSGVSAQFGVQPNDAARVGQFATISNIKITQGTKVVVDDHFQSATLDPAVWIVRARDAAGIFTVTPDLAFLVKWNLPDTGFSLKASPAVTGPWTSFGSTNLVGTERIILLNKNALPGPNSGFFRLSNP
jgi:hypothetical protein